MKQTTIPLSREDVLSEYSRVKLVLGCQPALKEFLSRSKVTQYNMVKCFRTFSRLVKAAGDTPHTAVAAEAPAEGVYFNAYGNYLRRYRSLPAMADWIHKDLTPGYRSFLWKFKCKWSEFPYIFNDWAAERPDWKDVLRLIPPRDAGRRFSKPWEAADPKLFDATPPMLHDIISFAFAEGSPAEFEKKCALAFRMLGFDVRELGSGKGRNPDGIARDIRGRYAVIYDAKSRRDHYTIGTDDRQFTEYIKEHKKALASAGYEMVFFLIISGAFGTMLPAPLNRIKLVTEVTASYITSENLLRIVACKTVNPNSYELGKIKELLVGGGEVTKEVIKALFK